MKIKTVHTGAALSVATATALSGCTTPAEFERGVIAEIPAKYISLEGLRYNVIDRDLGTNGNFLYREDNGENKINIVDADTIEFVTTESGAETTLTFNYNPGTDRWELEGNTDIKAQVFDTGNDYLGFYLTAGPGDDVFSGGFGILTEVMPTTTDDVTYSTNGFARLFAREDGADPGDENADIAVLGSGVDVTVNFDAGTITGTIFEASELFDLDDGGIDNDRVSLAVELDGTIAGSVFSGTVSGGDASADLNDDGLEVMAIDFNLTNTDADGGFYGDGAALVAGSWEGDFAFVEGETTLGEGYMIGVFDAER